MTIVNQYKCDDCSDLVGSVDEDSCVNILSNLRCTIRGKEIRVDKDKHFCSPACFTSYIHNLINKDTNGNGK